MKDMRKYNATYSEWNLRLAGDFVLFAERNLLRARSIVDGSARYIARIDINECDNEDMVEWAKDSEDLWLRIQDIQNQLKDLADDVRKYKNRFPCYRVTVQKKQVRDFK